MITRYQKGSRMSQAVTYGDMVFLAGQVAGTVVGAGVTAQTQEILGEIDRLAAKLKARLPADAAGPAVARQ